MFHFGSKKNNSKNDTLVSGRCRGVCCYDRPERKNTGRSKNRAEKLGILNVTEAGTEISDSYEKGQIIDQDVAKRRDRKDGTTIKVTVSAGSEEENAKDVDVPDVTENGRSSHGNTEDKNLTVSREFEFSNDVPSGQVIRQDPKAGKTVKEGTKVTIYISQGTESIKVTDVRGKSEADAKAALSDFDVTTTTEHSDTAVAEGNVISQSISGGQYAEKGASITIVVSSGPEKISYYIKSPVKAPTNVTVTSADISLYKAESSDLIQSWSGITSFPYTVEAEHDIDVPKELL